MKTEQGFNSGKLDRAVSPVEIIRLSAGGSAEKVTDRVIVEQPVTIMIDKVGSFTVMATPSDIEALAVGFLYSEGLINGIDDVEAISMKPELPNVIGLQIHDPTRIAVQRNMIVASSCGMCGTRNIDKMLSDVPACGHSLKVSLRLLTETADRLKSMQELFGITGGSHAAAIVDWAGEAIAFAEDLGRHSALDKAVGKCLKDRKSMKGCAVFLSGRVSLEMVTKAARAGLELIAAVSAPSSYAVQAADRWNITLCGFVRQGKMNVYAHPERICSLQREN